MLKTQITLTGTFEFEYLNIADQLFKYLNIFVEKMSIFVFEYPVFPMFNQVNLSAPKLSYVYMNLRLSKFI